MILPLLLAAASVSAVPCAEGNWVFRSGDHAMFQFGVHATPKGLEATWDRPQDLHSDDGETLIKVRGPVIRRVARSVRPVGEELELTFDDPEPGSVPDVFRLRCQKDGTLRATYAPRLDDPLPLVRASAAAKLGPWDASRSYPVVTSRPTNAEMTAIFEADQKDRTTDGIDWVKVAAADKARKARTQQLLDAGALQSGDDFYHAAFLFQHGNGPDDYLKAHLLAMIATARGKPDALWIASATLDRYLKSIGKPQVLGTQFMVPRGGKATQEPYDRTLISDAMRQALRVPPLAEQEKQRQGYDDDAAAQAKAAPATPAHP